MSQYTIPTLNSPNFSDQSGWSHNWCEIIFYWSYSIILPASCSEREASNPPEKGKRGSWYNLVFLCRLLCVTHKYPSFSCALRVLRWGITYNLYTYFHETFLYIHLTEWLMTRRWYFSHRCLIRKPVYSRSFTRVFYTESLVYLFVSIYFGIRSAERGAGANDSVLERWNYIETRLTIKNFEGSRCFTA